jgi:hypothetical protein
MKYGSVCSGIEVGWIQRILILATGAMVCRLSERRISG